MYQKAPQKGFTLIEVLLVVALIAILAGIVILAINPSKQIADTNNAQRRVDVNTILNAVYQYSIDNSGVFPAGIPLENCEAVSTNEICRTGFSCADKVDLSVLTDNKRYLVSLPTDPTASTTLGIGYYIGRTNTNGVNRITVCAPGAENDQTIEVER